MSELAKLLNNFKADFLSKAPAEVASLFGQKTVELSKSGILDKAIKIGDKIPSFDLPNVSGENVSIEKALSSGPVVISFYRGQWCPYCNIELQELQKSLAGFKEQGAKLLAISPQTPDNSLSTKEKNELEFDVLSDVGNKVAEKFGLVFSLDQELRPKYQDFGIDVPAHNGDQSYNLPLAATYVVSSDAVVKYAFVSADYTERAEPDEVIQTLKSL